MSPLLQQAFFDELEKIAAYKAAQAQTLGAGLLSLVGRHNLARAYNNLKSERLSRLLQWTIPGTKGIHLPGMNPQRVKILADQLSHPETALQIAIPATPIHMPIAEVIKRRLPAISQGAT